MIDVKKQASSRVAQIESELLAKIFLGPVCQLSPVEFLNKNWFLLTVSRICFLKKNKWWCLNIGF
jgi:hypothetical protein